MNIKDLIKKAFRAKQMSAEFSLEYDSLRKKIQQHFDTNSAENVIVADGIRVSKRSKIYITYFAEKLREKVSKSTFSKITSRTYYIKDINSLVELLKEAGIKPLQFKKLIDVKIEVKGDAIKQMYEVGDITKEDLDGCYEVKVTNFIDMRQVKEKGEDTD